MRQLRAGDFVMVGGIVADAWPSHTDVRFSNGAVVRLPFDAVIEVKRRAWQVGDRVSVAGPLTVGTPGAVVALHDDFAWVCLDTGVHVTFRTEDLE